MNLSIRLSFIVLLLCCISAAAQSDRNSKIFYNAGIDVNFDNREYDAGGRAASETIFGVRFSPELGLRYDGGTSSSCLAIGIDMRKDFGDPDKSLSSLLEEVKIYGSHSRDIGQTRFSITGGVFSRELMQEEWSEVFFSEKYLWTNPNISGLLVSDRWARGGFELACDWIGQYGSSYGTREQFLVMSAAHHNFNAAFSLGYNAYMMHFACSQETQGVVDNLLGEPWAKINFLPSPRGRWKELSLKAGVILSAQRDRNIGSEFDRAALGELSFKARYGSLSAINRYYLGSSIMSLYDYSDNSGYLYGDRLYLNDPFFIIDAFDGRRFGSHNTAELQWEPRLSERAKLSISARFHFHNHKYGGCQQIVRLIVDL